MKKENRGSLNLLITLDTILSCFILVVAVIFLLAVVVIHIGVRSNTEPQEVEAHTSSDMLFETITFLDHPIAYIPVGDQVDTLRIGDNQVEYSFFGKRFHKTYTVVDTIPPEIALLGDSTVVLDDISDYHEPGFEALDDYDGYLTNKVIPKLVQYGKNTYYMEYTVTDSSGNTGTAVRYIDVAKGYVYLTFDDGPSENITPQILKTLEDNGVRATFFIVGYDDSKANLILQEMNYGHTIGLHGYSHDYSKIYTSLDTLIDNFEKLGNMLETTTGEYRTDYIRFPGGSSNTVSKKYCKGIMTAAAEKVTSMGYTYFDWNVDSRDAGGAEISDEIYENVVAGIEPGRTNVVLMHDSATHQATADALQRIINYCNENNYVLKAINRDTEPVQHQISN